MIEITGANEITWFWQCHQFLKRIVGWLVGTPSANLTLTFLIQEPLS